MTQAEIPMTNQTQSGNLEMLSDDKTISRNPRLAHEGKSTASSPSPPHTCGGEGRGEEVSHLLRPPFMSQPWPKAVVLYFCFLFSEFLLFPWSFNRALHQKQNE